MVNEVLSACRYTLGKNSQYNKVFAKEFKKYILQGVEGKNQYSEFHFGAGESSIINMVSDIYTIEENGIVLIEEIENGLHPVSVSRLVEFLILMAKKKSIQVIFTTHSDYALEILPDEAIWSTIDGELYQGKLKIEQLRKIRGDLHNNKIYIYVEDNFARIFIKHILQTLGIDIKLFEIVPLGSDSLVKKIHETRLIDPTSKIIHFSFLDGDSRKKYPDAENIKNLYFLPGEIPEYEIISYIIENIDDAKGKLSMYLHVGFENQDFVKEKIINVVNSQIGDHHKIVSRIAVELGYLSKDLVISALIKTYCEANEEKLKSNYKSFLDKINEL